MAVGYTEHRVLAGPLRKLLVTARCRLTPETFPIADRGVVRRGQIWARQIDVDTKTRSKTGVYARMEVGALAEPTDRYLVAIAEALRLSGEEWINLWLYTRGYRPPILLNPVTKTTISPTWRLTVDTQTAPCYVATPDWAPIYWNRAADELMGPMPKNIIGRILLDESYRKNFPDWTVTWVPTALAQLRAARIELRDLDALRTLLDIEERVKRDPYLKTLYSTDLSPSLHPDGSPRLLIHARNRKTRRVGLVRSTLGPVPSIQGARIVTMHYSDLPTSVKADDPRTWPDYLAEDHQDPLAA